MTFAKKLSTLSTAFIFSGSIFAASSFTCPDINDIKSEGLHNVEFLFEFFTVYNASQYNTDEDWVFVIAPVFAKDENAALKTGNKVLQHMFTPGVPDRSTNNHSCIYETSNENYYAMAAGGSGLTPMKIKNLIQTILPAVTN